MPQNARSDAPAPPRRCQLDVDDTDRGRPEVDHQVAHAVAVHQEHEAAGVRMVLVSIGVAGRPLTSPELVARRAGQRERGEVGPAGDEELEEEWTVLGLHGPCHDRPDSRDDDPAARPLQGIHEGQRTDATCLAPAHGGPAASSPDGALTSRSVTGTGDDDGGTAEIERAGLGRRGFLVGIGAAAVLVAAGCQPVAVPSGGGPTTTAPPAGNGSNPFLRSTWSSSVGKTVALAGAGRTTTAVLTRISDVTGAPAGDARSFALAFQAPASGDPIELVETVQPAALPPLRITALPGGDDGAVRWYQAVVFNPTY